MKGSTQIGKDRMPRQRAIVGAAATAVPMVNAGTVIATPAAAAFEAARVITAPTTHDHAHTAAAKHHFAAGLLRTRGTGWAG
ncbi:hypothetical protein Pth03_82380 [Planotetraspora thailandica]|uniref:Uncharacterized protein n=1 Tax=Planotetraspora thailandica TaxID=487172 RepID=A0A8J4DFE3_9ACTN|nr:hypothetical protein [Planotetraspora thailandica]GII59849.1 hypothetical protein Pth03_82380 [Planotetraspora thailandica]